MGAWMRGCGCVDVDAAANLVTLGVVALCLMFVNPLSPTLNYACS